MQASHNELITRIGPGTACGALMRHYWHPVALLDEFDAALDPRMAQRPLKAVRLLGQDFVLFRDAQGRYSLLDRDCPHRGADLAFARHEGDGIRCPFHGWKFDADGRCLETPAEPLGSTLCERVRQRAWPVRVASGVVFAWLGAPGGPLSELPELPDIDALRAPASHVFAFKGLWHCNWLQAFEVGIDPAHASFLHRFLFDEPLEGSYGRQFRGASVGAVDGQKWPMSRVLREFHRPDIRFEPLGEGHLRLTTLRAIDERLMHVRVTNALFPYTFVIPLSETITITQMHVPVDDERTYWVAFFTSYAEPLDKHTMRSQRLATVELPDYLPRKGRHNDWGYDPAEQRTRTYLGMGESDINVHDQWAVESMGAIQDRTREHLGSSDKVIVAHRRQLMAAIETVRQGGAPPRPRPGGGPDTLDCIAPADDWAGHWASQVRRLRAGAPWLQPAGSVAEAGSAA